MVISAEKTDIVRYYAERSYARRDLLRGAAATAEGLCDAVFRAEPFARQHEQVLIGLPDTVWFPENAYYPALNPGSADVNLVLFPVQDPSAFDAVVCDPQNFVTQVEVKVPTPQSNWIWGAITTTGESFPQSEAAVGSTPSAKMNFLGSLLNAYIDAGNTVRGHHVGETYIDVGTMEGFHRAQDFLRGQARTQMIRMPAA